MFWTRRIKVPESSTPNETQSQQSIDDNARHPAKRIEKPSIARNNQDGWEDVDTHFDHHPNDEYQVDWTWMVQSGTRMSTGTMSSQDSVSVTVDEASIASLTFSNDSKWSLDTFDAFQDSILGKRDDVREERVDGKRHPVNAGQSPSKTSLVSSCSVPSFEIPPVETFTDIYRVDSTVYTHPDNIQLKRDCGAPSTPSNTAVHPDDRIEGCSLPIINNTTLSAIKMQQYLLHLPYYSEAALATQDIQVQWQFLSILRNLHRTESDISSQNRLNSEILLWFKRLSDVSVSKKDTDPSSALDRKIRSEVQYLYAECLRKSDAGISSDLKAAWRLYERSAKKGYAPSWFRAGECCELGLGRRRDLKRAVMYYNKGALMNHYGCILKLVVIYSYRCHEFPVRKGIVEGLKWLRILVGHALKESNLCDVYALAGLYEFAEWYTTGPPEKIPGFIEDARYAVDMYRESALRGYAPAQFKLGEAYTDGLLGLKQDKTLALYWYNQVLGNNYSGEDGFVDLYQWQEMAQLGVEAIRTGRAPQSRLSRLRSSVLNDSMERRRSLMENSKMLDSDSSRPFQIGSKRNGSTTSLTSSTKQMNDSSINLAVPKVNTSTTSLAASSVQTNNSSTSLVSAFMQLTPSDISSIRSVSQHGSVTNIVSDHPTLLQKLPLFLNQREKDNHTVQPTLESYHRVTERTIERPFCCREEQEVSRKESFRQEARALLQLHESDFALPPPLI